ncbi:MAG TPA: 6-phosphogluconolactonase [Candidatus Microsaccharimonas sp.]|nr:6-phosphogluconolactonase [Candidatus Microsaccharimonas sp.]
MEFIRTTGWERGIKDLTARLTRELKADKKVLWLIGGGSNIEASVKVMAALPEEETKNLSIFMTDERYGDVGHIHSNSKQLVEADFQPKEAIFVPMLQPGFSMDETQERYGQALERAIDHADIVIAQSGIGADGHIAGILPHSPAVHATGWVTGYQAPNYLRMTMTFDALRRIDAAYYMAFGEDKRAALTRLRNEAVPLEEQPSQILKELSEAYVYNDQIGDKT